MTPQRLTEGRNNNFMTQQKSAQINLSQALMQVSLKAIAAIGSATGLPWLAGLTALPDALVDSEVLRSALGKHEPLRMNLPAPAFWTQSADSWQHVCSNIEHQLPTIFDRVATALKGVSVPTDAVVQDLLLQSIAQSLPTWEVPAQERGLVAVYLARQFFTKAANELAPVLAPLRSDALLDMTANVLELLQRAQVTAPPHGDAEAAASPAIPAQTIASVATTLQKKMQAEAYDVYLCSHEEDEQEALAIGEALKGRGLLPWFDFLARPGTLRRKEQERFITTLPAAAILVGQHGIEQWQELQMYALLDQFVVRQDFPLIPVLLKSAPAVATLPPFLATIAWVDYHRTVPDPLGQLIWGITGKRPTL
jgi:hypothetical protein